MTEDIPEYKRPKKGEIDHGRMGENIITNEFIQNRFIVTHLDKGTRGVSANADLMIGHEKLERPVLVQVKSCYADSGSWIFLGSFDEEKRLGNSKIYNNKKGFFADFVVFIGIQDPKKYNYFVVPINVAEKIARDTWSAICEVPKKDQSRRQPPPGMYLAMSEKESKNNRSANSEIQKLLSEARTKLLPYQEKVDVIFERTV